MRSLLAAGLVVLLIGSAAFKQQQIPIRTVGPATAQTSTRFSLLMGVRELANRRLLVNDPVRRQLLVLDANLNVAEAIADTASGVRQAYPGGPRPRLMPYVADSALLADVVGSVLLVISPEGKITRAAAIPVQQHSFALAGLQPNPGVDAKGRLIYQLNPPVGIPPTDRNCMPGVAAAGGPPEQNPDSAFIVRADFNTRTADTVARVRVVRQPGRITMRTSDCRITATKQVVNPVLPALDAWTVTSDGTIAIVRGTTYHIDWIDASGTVRSTPKLPFAWRRLTDADKQAKVDSARAILDSAAKANQMTTQACSLNGRDIVVTTFPDGRGPGAAPPAGTAGAAGAGGGGDARGGGGRGGDVGGGGGGPPPITDCRPISNSLEFVPFSEMADYPPPIAGGSVMADLDGNVWIIPTTSTEAKGGLLYDVVNRKGELFERVQLPPASTIVAFGKGGVLYVSVRSNDGTWSIERRSVNR